MVKVPILVYHSVSPNPPKWIAPFSVTPETFASQMASVSASGRQPMTVSDYIDAQRGFRVLPQWPVLITFDDGFADFAEHALPAMVTWNIPSTLYVTTGALAEQRTECALPPAPMLKAADLEGLEAAGVEIGAHSHTHRQLDLLADREVTAELQRSSDMLADVLGHAVRSFAYPHGYWRARVRRLVDQAGFDSACAVGEAFSSDSDHPLSLSRLMVRSDTPPRTIDAWLKGKGAGPASQGRRVLAYGWRQSRRVRQRQRKGWLA